MNTGGWDTHCDFWPVNARTSESGRRSKLLLVPVLTSVSCVQPLANDCWHWDRGERAKEQFEKCIATDAWEFFEYNWAKTCLARMEKDPNWPHWVPVETP